MIKDQIPIALDALTLKQWNDGIWIAEIVSIIQQNEYKQGKALYTLEKCTFLVHIELKAWEFMTTNILYWTWRIIWDVYSSPHGIPKDEAHLPAWSCCENQKEHSEASIATLGDIVFPLLLPKRQINPTTGLLLPGPHPLALSST